ncbi:MAG: PEP-CTERM sorting domain-containing protein [Verrucomicrobiaceae bacterium]|nr:MAG: PEP-CTERM sorting domain-containing protein [Verrucomicrobiaceae bacterium]
MKILPSHLLAAVLSGGLTSFSITAHAAVITGVTVTDSATAFSPDYSADKAVDGDTSDYASQNQGADTFLQFAFPGARQVNRVVVMNRDSPAEADWIGNFTLTFDGGLSTSIARTAIRGGSAIISLGGTYTTTGVRLDVATTGSASLGGNTGAQEVFFLSPMTGKTAVSGVTVAGSATPFSADYAAAGALDGIVGRSQAAGVTPEYASAGLGVDAYVDFNLGAILPVGGFDLFDRPAGADRVSAFDLIFSVNSVFGDGDDTTLSFNGTGMATSGEFASIQAQYVRYDVTAKSGAGVNTGLSEIVFYAAIPEPSSAAVSLAALAGLGLRRRRR